MSICAFCRDFLPARTSEPVQRGKNDVGQDVVATRTARLLVCMAALAAGWMLARLQADGQVQASPDALLRAPAAADGGWRWVSLDPDEGSETGWRMESGTARVTVLGSRFAADLKLTAPQAGPDRRLQGTLSGAQVTAREMLLETDARALTVHGTDLDDGIEERLVFHGGPAGEASFLALYRPRPGEPRTRRAR